MGKSRRDVPILRQSGTPRRARANKVTSSWDMGMGHGDIDAGRVQNELARCAEANMLRNEVTSTVPVSQPVKDGISLICTTILSFGRCRSREEQLTVVGHHSNRFTVQRGANRANRTRYTPFSAPSVISGARIGEIGFETPRFTPRWNQPSLHEGKVSPNRVHFGYGIGFVGVSPSNRAEIATKVRQKWKHEDTGCGLG